MKRNAIQDLISWKNDEERKPLVLKGARQVGKTWLMKEFGKNYYFGQTAGKGAVCAPDAQFR